MASRPPIIDMRPDGSFRQAPGSGTMLSTRIALAAILVAVVGIALTVAAVAIWFVALILPAVIIAAGVAYIALKFRGWRIRRGQGAAPNPFGRR